MYAPFGAGILVGPRATFADGDPFLAGGGAVDLVDLEEVAWTDPPEREEAGSPNVLGAVALHAAIDELGRIGFEAIAATRPTPRPPPAPRAVRTRAGSACSVPTRWWRLFRSPPSPSTASPTHWWRPASAPSTASGYDTAASAPTPT